MIYKRCSSCKTEKAIEFFSPKNNQCKECRKATSKKYRDANKEKCYKASRKSVAKNPESALRIQAKYRDVSAEKASAKREKYKQTHGIRWKLLVKQWAKNNRERLRVRDAKRRAALLNAIPSWVDYEKIRAVYQIATRLSEETGILHVVDHIIPLQGKTVCGLHVEGNLRVITQTENLIKGNKLLPELF